MIAKQDVHKFAARFEYLRPDYAGSTLKNTRQTKTFVMKKTVLFAAAIFTVTAVNAQTGEITSARGENWLSQDGDWALTFDAQPLLTYVGNLFNNGNNGYNTMALNNLFNSNSLTGNFGFTNGSNVVIGGKKLIDANTAYRGKLRIGFGSNKTTSIVTAEPEPDPAPSYPNPLPTTEDVTKESFMAINLGAGIEKRVGSTRVVGVYGAELNVGFGNSKTTNEYGNAYTSDFNGAPRVTESKTGSVFGLGLNAFAGVEWFCAPKISLSGEYSWGLWLTSQGYGSTTTEYWVPNASDPSTGTVQSITEDSGPKHSNFSLDTGVSGASIGVNFYFQ